MSKKIIEVKSTRLLVWGIVDLEKNEFVKDGVGEIFIFTHERDGQDMLNYFRKEYNENAGLKLCAVEIL